MHIDTPRFVLRDFEEAHRPAFVAYQRDPRYRRLYDLSSTGGQQSHELFTRFLAWQQESPRRNFQIGIFERGTGRLYGCAGLRKAGMGEGTAVLGIELAPDDWGRYRLAIEVVTALIEHGFDDPGLHAIAGSTASGNRRVERLARWFGAEIIARRVGPEWMTRRGWVEVDWALRRDDWLQSPRRRSLVAG